MKNNIKAKDDQEQILEMAKRIRAICMQIEYGECSSKCECYDHAHGFCLLSGNDPSDWDIGEKP